MEELKKWLNDNYFSLLSQSETMGFKQSYDTIRLKVQDLIDKELSNNKIENIEDVLG